jgi:two-component system, LytTR family, sensor kinase
LTRFKSYPLEKRKRFRFWRVFWIVLGLYILFALIGIIAVYVTPANEKKIDIHDIFTLKHLLNQCINFVFIVFYYYFTLNAFYRLMQQKKSAVHYIRICVITVLSLVAFYLLSVFFLNDEKKLKEMASTGLLVFSYAIATVFYLCLSLLISYFIFLWDERKQRKVLEEQKLQLEIEKSQANFNFLKAQINPHFLHNTLNFLYAKSLPYSEELSEGILTLSDIMRYALSEGNAKDGKAPLKDEIEHVRNVIKINQLRFSNSLNVQFEVEGVVNGAMIIPFVLITLVENAFKHGDLKSTADPIDIKLKVSSGNEMKVSAKPVNLTVERALVHKLYFYCRNRKKSGPKELGTGIGLENIKKRLDLAYGKDYIFNVKDEEDYYTTELTINKL